MFKMPRSLLLHVSLLAVACGLVQQAQAAPACANADETTLIRHYYGKVRPGAPPPVPGRMYRMKEAVVVSALPDSQAYGIRSSPAFFDKLWKSIDAWGAETEVGLVFTSGGRHAWNFPSKVPITQATTDEFMYDMYADNGNGVHGHITQSDVDSIWALDLPGAKAGESTRILGFYNPEGDLILGIYVSAAGKPFDAKAVEGFEKTKALLKSEPRLCAG